MENKTTMSSNKNKYFVVEQVSVVSAKNKAEAIKAANSGRRVAGTNVLISANSVDRVPASAARSMASTDS